MSAKMNIPFVIKPNFISLVFNKENYSFNSKHPLYAQLRGALETGNNKKIRGLLDMASEIEAQTAGKVRINKNEVTVDGVVVHNACAKRIISLFEAGEPIKHMLRFMDNTKKNPNPAAVEELYESLELAKNPPTDDGCFVMYKVVKKASNGRDLLDCYTGTVDNNVGTIVAMPRSKVDADRRRECSYGLHVCTLGYIRSFSGNTVIKVKVHPADVIAVPRDYGYTKMRVCRYEVLEVLGSHDEIRLKGHSSIENAAVAPVKLERQQLLKKLLAHPTIKRNIRNGKIAETTIRKMTYGRMRSMYAPLEAATQAKAKAALPAPTVAERARLFQNTLGPMREAHNITRTELAEELGISYKSIWRIETNPEVSVETSDRFILALNTLVKSNANALTLKGDPSVKRVDLSRAKGVFDQLAVV